MTTLAEAAAKYAAEGWEVFPLKPRGKLPLTGKGGYKHATTDAAQVRAWWRRWPDANIGVVPGKRGLFVADVDGPEGEASAAALGLLAVPTLEVRTGRPDGGRHLYFQRPDLPQIGNADVLGDGINVRCDAGYVVLPPSLHESGRQYEWVREMAAAPLPSGAVARLNGHAVPVAPSDVVPADVVDDDDGVVRLGDHEGRNNALTSFLGGVVARGVTDSAALLAAARAYNKTAFRVPLPDTEVQSVHRSAMERWVAKATEPQRPRFTLYSIEELAALADPAWLVQGMIPAGGMAELVGVPGVGKTFVALDLALRIATAGIEDAPCWFGRAVRPGRVLYVSAEGQSFFRHRVSAALSSLRRTSAPDFLTMLEAVDLVDTLRAVPAFLAAVTARVPALDLLVLDTLQRCTPGSDENASVDQGRAIASVDRLRRELGCAVLTLHHPNAGGSKPRGWTGWDGAADAILALEDNGNGLTLKSTKIKDGPPMEPLRLRLVSYHGSAVVAVSEAPVRVDLPPTRERVLRALTDGARTTEWERSAALPKQTFYDHRAGLLAAGLVAEGPKGRWTVTAAGMAALGTDRSTAVLRTDSPESGTDGTGGRSPRTSVLPAGREDPIK